MQTVAPVVAAVIGYQTEERQHLTLPRKLVAVQVASDTLSKSMWLYE